MKRLFIVIFLLLVACSPKYKAHTPESSQKSSIAWKDYSPAIFSVASHDKKPVFLYLKLESCSVCAKMDEEVLTDPIVIHTINDSFIPVKIVKEDDSDFFYRLASKHKIESVPSFLVLSYPNYERPVIVKEGYTDINMLIALLKISKGMSSLLNLQTISNDLLDTIEGK